MQDPDTPPQEEGNINGAVDAVRPDAARVAPWAVPARKRREFLPRPWITVIAPTRTATMATAADPGAPVFRPLTRFLNRNRCRFPTRMRLRASLRLSKTSSS